MHGGRLDLTGLAEKEQLSTARASVPGIVFGSGEICGSMHPAGRVHQGGTGAAFVVHGLVLDGQPSASVLL